MPVVAKYTYCSLYPFSATMHPVTVIIPSYNEADFIVACLESVLHGNYPTELLEILVVDGQSTDATVAKTKELSLSFASIRLLDNPKRIVSAALNLGIKHASHDILIWLGSHAIYDKDYILNSVNTLLKLDCASVGGVIKPVAKSSLGQVIAIATSSKFGIGNAKYRYADMQQSVDTVFGGCWKKENVLKIGGFDEKWLRNQDYEFNCRLRAEIGEIILDPTVRCQYFCRESLAALAEQYFNYGYWRFHTFMQHPASFTRRQAVPLLLFIGLLTSSLLVFFEPVLASVIPLFYLLVSIAVSSWKSYQHGKPSYMFLLPAIFATLHLCWPLGFLKGALDRVVAKIGMRR